MSQPGVVPAPRLFGARGARRPPLLSSAGNGTKNGILLSGFGFLVRCQPGVAHLRLASPGIPRARFQIFPGLCCTACPCEAGPREKKNESGPLRAAKSGQNHGATDRGPLCPAALYPGHAAGGRLLLSQPDCKLTKAGACGSFVCSYGPATGSIGPAKNHLPPLPRSKPWPDLDSPGFRRPSGLASTARRRR